MARTSAKRKTEMDVTDQLVRHLPKGSAAIVRDLHPDDIEKLAKVRSSKVREPARNEKRKDRGEGPTPQRIDQSDGSHVVGDDKQGHRTYTMLDSPLDRLWARQRIDSVSYSALKRYHLHWYHAGLQPGCGSVDLNRVFASDPGCMSGMAKSERQAFHRQQWRLARDKLGHQTGIVVDNIVCAEWSLDIAGYSVGYTSPYRAREGARTILKDAGRVLAKLWGIG